MAEPAHAAAAATGLTVLGIATGLDPGLLFAGMAGGWWALSYTPEPMPLLRRMTLATIAALAGAWFGQPAGAVVAALAVKTFPWWPAEAGVGMIRYGTAMVVGLLAHRQIGPLLMRKVEAIGGEADK